MSVLHRTVNLQLNLNELKLSFFDVPHCRYRNIAYKIINVFCVHILSQAMITVIK